MHLHSWLGLSIVILVFRAGKFPWWLSKWDSNPSAILQFHFQPPLQCQVKPITSPCFWHPPKSVEDPPEPPVLDDEEVDGWWCVHVWGRFVKVLRGKKGPKKGCTPQVVPGNSLCLFGGWWSVTPSKVVGDLQIRDKKGHELNHLVHVIQWPKKLVPGPVRPEPIFRWTFAWLCWTWEMPWWHWLHFYRCCGCFGNFRKQQLWQRKWWNDKLVDTISDGLENWGCG